MLHYLYYFKNKIFPLFPFHVEICKTARGKFQDAELLHTLKYQFSSVAQSCPTICDPMSARPPCPSQASVLVKLHSQAFKVGKTEKNLQKELLLLFFTHSHSNSTYRRRRWHPTPVLLPGKSHGQRSLVGCGPWGREESDTTERLPFHFSLSCIGEGNGNPLQCSCLENPRDGGAWWAAVYGVTQSQTQLKWLSSSSSSRECSNFILYL